MILALASNKPGVSKSTLAVSFAFELARRGDSVLLVDSDIGQRTCVRRSDAGDWPSLSRAPHVMLADHNLHLPHQVPALAKLHRHVVIDTPGRMSREQAAALWVADVALGLTGPSDADTETLDALIPVLLRAQDARPNLKVALVLTLQRPGTRMAAAAREALTGLPVPLLVAGTCDRTAWGEVMNTNLGVTRHAPKSAAADELRALLAEVKALHRRKKR